MLTIYDDRQIGPAETVNALEAMNLCIVNQDWAKFQEREWHSLDVECTELRKELHKAVQGELCLEEQLTETAALLEAKTDRNAQHAEVSTGKSTYACTFKSATKKKQVARCWLD